MELLGRALEMFSEVSVFTERTFFPYSLPFSFFMSRMDEIAVARQPSGAMRVQ